jgi:hypothetical protein
MQKMILLPYERYQRLLQQREASNVPSQETTTPNPDIEEVSPEPIGRQDLEEKLLSSFPKNLRSRARALLTHISTRVTWNDMGEVIIDGVKIPGSNIMDLVKVQLKDYKDLRPTGLEKFTDILKDTNVPLSLLTSSRRVQTGQGIIPPPPGSPVKRKVKRKTKWLRL